MRIGTLSAFGAMLGLALLCGTTGAETGNVCVGDYRPGATCLGQDVRLARLEVVSVTESCSEGVVGEAEVVLRAVLSSVGSPDRYDIGFFLALDSGSASTGHMCYHGHLGGPLAAQPTYGDHDADGNADIVDGPWWNADGDSCGDLKSNTQVFVTLPPLRIACADVDGDGFVDLSVATSWDISTLNSCSKVSEAYPSSGSKCSTQRVKVDPLPVGPTVSVEEPRDVDLASRPRPNPFTGTTRLAYAVDAARSRVEIGVFDIAGRRIRALASGFQEPGNYTVSWDGTTDRGAHVPAGVYWIRACVGNRQQRVSVAFLH
jgi:hypothetical protein